MWKYGLNTFRPIVCLCCGFSENWTQTHTRWQGGVQQIFNTSTLAAPGGRCKWEIQLKTQEQNRKHEETEEN